MCYNHLRFVLGLIVGSIVFPTTLLTTLAFGRAARSARKRYRILCYIIALLYCAACGTLTIVYTIGTYFVLRASVAKRAHGPFTLHKFQGEPVYEACFF